MTEKLDKELAKCLPSKKMVQRKIYKNLTGIGMSKPSELIFAGILELCEETLTRAIPIIKKALEEEREERAARERQLKIDAVQQTAERITGKPLQREGSSRGDKEGVGEKPCY